MKCPRCGREHNDNWPIHTAPNTVVDGGCQECWEHECDESWAQQASALMAIAETLAASAGCGLNAEVSGGRSTSAGLTGYPGE